MEVVITKHMYFQIKEAKVMFTKWDCIDSDCCQYIRSDGNIYEMIQAVWLDTTEEDRANGAHE